MPMSGSNNFRNGYIILRHLVLNARYEALVRVGPVKTLHTMGSGGGEFCKI